MHVVAVKTHRRHYQRTVAVELAVDVAATVLAIPLALLVEHVVQIRIGAERSLLAQIALDVAATRVGERGKGKHRHIAELRVASAVVQNGLRGRGVEHGDLGQDHSGFLSRLGLGLRGLIGRRRLVRNLGLDGCNLGSLDLSDLRLLGNRLLGSCSRLGLGLHRRDKAGRHTVKLANTGKRTLDILGARFGHSCHVTLGGLSTGLALGIGLTRSVGPAVTVPVVDVCHRWPPFLSLPLSAFPIHDTPPRTKKTAPKDRLSHRFTRTASTAAIRR